jgi:prophage regulatory protein
LRIVVEKTMRLLRRPQVEAKTGKSCSSIYAGILAGTFPAPIETDENSVAWVEEEIDAWIAARIAKREAKLAEIAAKRNAYIANRDAKRAISNAKRAAQHAAAKAERVEGRGA